MGKRNAIKAEGKGGGCFCFESTILESSPTATVLVISGIGLA